MHHEPVALGAISGVSAQIRNLRLTACIRGRHDNRNPRRTKFKIVGHVIRTMTENIRKKYYDEINEINISIASIREDIEFILQRNNFSDTADAIQLLGFIQALNAVTQETIDVLFDPPPVPSPVPSPSKSGGSCKLAKNKSKK